MQLVRTVAVSLQVTEEQASALAALRPLVTGAYNDAAAHAWKHNVKGAVELHHAVYRVLRERYRLPSQFVCNVQRLAMSSVVALRIRRAKGKPVGVPHAARLPIPYDARSMSLRANRKSVTLATLGKRIEVPLVRHKLLAKYADWTTDSGKVRQCSDGSWELLLTFTKDVSDVIPTAASTVIGCDRGIVNPAVLSTGQFLGDARWHQRDRAYFRTQRSLQRKGTKSAKRRLKQRSRKWARFREWCDQNITTQIVRALPSGSVLVLEDLTNIRVRGRRFHRKMRRRLHAWSFRRQQDMLAYKAPAARVSLVFVDAKYTSQKCSSCGTTAKKSRRSQSRFVCVQCGHAEHADLNAARNIAANWVISQQIVDPLVASGNTQVNPPNAVPDKDARNPKVGRGLRAKGTAKAKPKGSAKSPG